MAVQSDARVDQETAAELARRFRSAFSSIAMAAERSAMAVIFADTQADGHPVVFANGRFANLMGLTEAEVLGMKVDALLLNVTDIPSLSNIESEMKDGASGVAEGCFRRPGGREYFATVFYNPIFDLQGNPCCYFLGIVEVSARMSRLAEQHELFDELYSLAPGIIAVSEGPDHRFVYANESYKKLICRDNILGLRVTDALPELETQGIIEILDQVYQSGEPFIADTMPMHLTRDGEAELSLRYLSFVYQPVRDSLGNVRGIFLEGFDVTAERQAAEQLSVLHNELAHATRVNAMGMMAATIAHELNQPLAAIASYSAASARLVDPVGAGAGDLLEALGAIEEATQRAGRVIRSLRDLTRRGETSETRFNLKSAITGSIKLVGMAGCSDATIQDETPDDIFVLGDRIQIEQVIINLLRNSCEAIGSRTGGLVTVGASRQGGEVICRISDNGPGMDPEAAQQIFDWTNSSKPDGTGLGLAISRTIIEGHSGRIWLEYTGPGGSRFCFSLSAADGAVQ